MYRTEFTNYSDVSLVLTQHIFPYQCYHWDLSCDGGPYFGVGFSNLFQWQVKAGGNQLQILLTAGDTNTTHVLNLANQIFDSHQRSEGVNRQILYHAAPCCRSQVLASMIQMAKHL